MKRARQHAGLGKKAGAKAPRHAARFAGFWLGTVDALPLRVFESLFSAAFLFRMGRNLVNGTEWLTPDGFHLTPEEIASLGYPPALPLLPGWALPLFAVVLLGCPVAVILNRCRRAALWGCFACAVYVQGADYLGAFAYNKIFIAIFALLATGPGLVREAQTGRLVVCATLVRVFQATLIVIYFAAGVSKCSPGDWLKHSDVLWTQVMGFHRNEFAAWLLRSLPKWTWAVQQYLALTFELLAPLLFTVQRLRPVALVVGIGFHLIIALLMKNLLFFSVQMWAFYALFITSDQWRAVGAWIVGWLNRLRRVPKAVAE